MRQVDLGGLTCRVVGGEDRAGGGTGPAVILLHGYGAPGTDLVPLWRSLRVPPEVRFVFPEAPIALGPPMAPPGGRAWWHIDVAALEHALRTGSTRELSAGVPEGLVAARERVSALLDAVTHDLAAPSERVVLGGFSQGAMLACDVALHDPRPLAGLVLMSGTVVAEREWAPRYAARKGLPVIMSHGRADPLLPFSVAERWRDDLRAAGLDVAWHPFGGGHGIADGLLDALGPFIEQHTRVPARTTP